MKILNRFKDQSHIQTILEYITLFLISFLFVLIFALWESPLYPHWYGCDASFFSMVGRAITKGMVPYRDFFDLKGPYFFFIQALGQWIHVGRLGTFITEVIFFYFSLILLYLLANLYLPKRKSLIVLIFFLVGHIATLWGGNTLEEFFLPLNLLCLFLLVRFLKPGHKEVWELPSGYALLFGICLGLFLFSKITVGAPLLGIIATIVFLDIIHQKYKQCFHFFIFLLLGLLLAILPVFFYFWYHNSLLEMLYDVFVFATKRSRAYGDVFTPLWELKMIGTVFAFIFALSHKKELNSTLRILLIGISAATYFALHLGTPFIYYFTTCYPAMLFALILFLDIYKPLILFRNLKQTICLLLLGSFLFFYIKEDLDTVNSFLTRKQDTWNRTYYEKANELASLIPEWEQDDVYCFWLDCTWFEATGLLPCYKYQINLQFFISLDPRIENNIRSYLSDTPPKWIVAGKDFAEILPSLYDTVCEKYHCISENESGMLYLLNE